jgi:peroxiredoxin (alkyl hydroperoxide reductase subunit C)
MKNFIGKMVINFTAPAVLDNGSIVKDFNFYDNIKDKSVLLFFYPMDFTFVCPSELIAINNFDIIPSFYIIIYLLLYQLKEL